MNATSENTAAANDGNVVPWRACLFVFAFFLVVYAMTANRGVQWQDSGTHMLRVLTGELINPRGLALTHPLHYWICRAALWFGLVSAPLSITLVSSIAAAIAVACTFGCVWSLTGRLAASLLAACSLGVAHTFWQMATLTETNTVVAAILAAECWALILYLQNPDARRLWLVFALNGLGLANHNLALLTLPVISIVAITTMRHAKLTSRDLLIAAVVWMLGATSYIALIVSEAGRSGDLPAAISSALFGISYRDEVFNVSLSARRMGVIAGFFLLNFPNLLIPLAIVGLIRGRSLVANRPLWLALVASFLIHAAFALRYPVVDQHTFFLPTYVYLAIFAGLGVTSFARKQAHSYSPFVKVAFALLIATPLIYAATPGIARRMHMLEGYERNKPYRDDYVYLFTPWSIADQSAQRMSDHALRLAGDAGLIVVPDTMAEPAVLSAIQEHKGNKSTVLPALDDLQLELAIKQASPIVLVPMDVEHTPPPTPMGQWRRDGDLYILDPAAPDKK